MDPSDVVDYKIDLSAMLDTGDNVADYSVVVLPDALLLGLVLGNGVRAPVLKSNILQLWFSIDPTYKSNPLFVGGVTLPLELTVLSDAVPSRTRQRTFAVRVVQR
jgi:hypothetical protein